MARILLFDEDPRFRAFVQRALELEGHSVLSCDRLERASDQLVQSPFDVVVTEACPPHLKGMALLRFVSRWLPETAVVLLSTHEHPSVSAQAQAWGASCILTKPLRGPAELCDAVARAAAGNRRPAPFGEG